MFSVVIPLYNKEKYILRAIESVLAQTYKDFELIVVDDGSADDSFDIVNSISDARVKLVRQHNQGGSGGPARNTGMKIAQGTWFAFLDADDIWFSDHLAELAKVIESYPDCRIVSSSTAEILEGTNVLKIDRKISKILKIDYFDASSRKIGIINSSSVSIHNSIFKNLGGFISVKSGEDLEYWARIALNYSLAISHKVTAVYFRGNGGSMEMLDKQKKSVPVSRSLENISPSVAMLSRELDRIESSDEVLFAKVQRYINSRVSAVIRGYLIQGDIEKIKITRHLYIQPCTHESSYWYFLSHLPTFALHAYSTSRRIFKKTYKLYLK